MFHTYNFIYAFYVGHNLSLFITGIIVIIIHSTFMLVLSKLSILCAYFFHLVLTAITYFHITNHMSL